MGVGRAHANSQKIKNRDCYGRFKIKKEATKDKSKREQKIAGKKLGCQQALGEKTNRNSRKTDLFNPGFEK